MQRFLNAERLDDEDGDEDGENNGDNGEDDGERKSINGRLRQTSIDYYLNRIQPEFDRNLRCHILLGCKTEHDHYL
ncbi:hypothetical protein GJ496_001424 [Pomphorhynchus laevis]|nr:hypothetical protein GJ496_001424 [Pomphorhynchus laevis]